MSIDERSQTSDLHAVGDRIESLLDELRSSTEGRVWLRVEELVRLLTELYGEGMARTLELAAGHPDLVARLARDDLVGSLMVLHDLHPEPLGQRVAAAVEAVTPRLRTAEAAVEITHLDPEAGTVTMTVTATGSGCGSAAGPLADAVRQAVGDAAPDAEVEVRVVTDPGPTVTPVRLGRKPVVAGQAP